MPFARMTALLLLAFAAMPAVAAEAVPWSGMDFLASSQTAPTAAPPIPLLSAAPVDEPALGARSAETGVAGSHLRKVLADFAVTLRNIRYRRGGDSPSTGFDCSGFVRYVFQHSLGQELPTNSASQYRVGRAIARDDLKIGDLVFFHIRGKRVSHVGIYLGHGRFIHSPSTGRTVSISSLDDGYWSRHFAGAKRPKILS